MTTRHLVPCTCNSEQPACRALVARCRRMGPLAQRTHEKELAAMREHMRVEGENIKRIIETQARESTPHSKSVQ